MTDFCGHYNVPLQWFREDGYGPECFPDKCSGCNERIEKDEVKNVG